jgi:hypothetical protein
MNLEVNGHPFALNEDSSSSAKRTNGRHAGNLATSRLPASFLEENGSSAVGSDQGQVVAVGKLGSVELKTGSDSAL